MTAIDDLVARATGTPAPPSSFPHMAVAIVTCMDARLDIHGIFKLELGDAHIIRNAGGVVTDDVIRSLAVSQRERGTREIMIVHHTSCGLLSLDDEKFRRQLQAETGLRPTWATEAFDDLDEEVRHSIARVRTNPFLPHRDSVRGFVYELETGRLREVR